MIFRGDIRGKHAHGANAGQRGTGDGGQTQYHHHQRPRDLDELSRQGHPIGASSAQSCRRQRRPRQIFT
jgi:hypothetical protein